jgi:hypothetical protein
MKFKGICKKTNKTIKGNLFNIGKKHYIVSIKSITNFMGADYILLKGGCKNYEVFNDSIELIEK